MIKQHQNFIWILQPLKFRGFTYKIKFYSKSHSHPFLWQTPRLKWFFLQNIWHPSWSQLSVSLKGPTPFEMSSIWASTSTASSWSGMTNVQNLTTQTRTQHVLSEWLSVGRPMVISHIGCAGLGIGASRSPSMVTCIALLVAGSRMVKAEARATPIKSMKNFFILFFNWSKIFWEIL